MLTRRAVLQFLPALGITSTVFARSLAQEAAGSTTITKEMIANAQWVSGIELTDEQLEALEMEVNSLQSNLIELNKVKLDPQQDMPALNFLTLAHQRTPSGSPVIRYEPTERMAGKRPDSDEALSFLSLTELGAMIRDGQTSSVVLTTLYLERLKKFDPMLRCVVNLTEDLALRQAQRADQELAQGKYRGPLHGVPWGAKDLISVPGYPTTWGIPVFQDRVLDQTATVAQRLESAGAVLVAKLSLGAIAMGDQWFRGMTRNPWNPKIGSSGSSAGSAAATSAGLVGFALGTETLGSILSPSIRCGTCGLRPTYGRVSRAGCMPLSFSMDKVGPIARSVEDLALVFGAILGPDGQDPTVVEQDFIWPQPSLDFAQFRVGVLKPRRENARPDPSLDIIQKMGCQIVEVELPADFPWRSLTKIIDIEGASVFNDLLRAGETEGWNTWTRSFQTAQFITAIDYLKMQRVRRQLMTAFENVMRDIDILWNARDLLYTNFTGHPSVVFPTGVRVMNATAVPQTVVATGHLFDEARLLAFCHSYQQLLAAPMPLPPVNDWWKRFEQGELDPQKSEDESSEKSADKASGDTGKKNWP